MTAFAPLTAGCFVLLVCAAPSTATAQSGAPAASATASAQTDTASGRSPLGNFMFTGGGSFSTVRGDCQTCEGDYPYRHSGSVIADIGHRVNPRMDVAAEIFWMPVETTNGHLHSTHLDGVAQFRPWASKGFFVKGGAGMAFVHNWVDGVGTEPVSSKALSIVIGAGWAFHPSARVGYQLFGLQHAAAMGDLQTGDSQVSDVMGNFWSLGAAIVIR